MSGSILAASRRLSERTQAARDETQQRRAAREPRIRLIERTERPVFVSMATASTRGSEHVLLAETPARMIGGVVHERLPVRVDGETNLADLGWDAHQTWLRQAITSGRLELPGLGRLVVFREPDLLSAAGVALVTALRRAGVAVWLSACDDTWEWVAWHRASRQRGHLRTPAGGAIVRAGQAWYRVALRALHGEATGVITTTPHLAERIRARGHARQVRCIPLAVGPAELQQAPRPQSGPLRIGFAGHQSKYWTGDLDPVLPVLRELAQRPDVELHLWGAPGAPGRHRLNAHMQPDPAGTATAIIHAGTNAWRAYQRDLGILDVALAPLADTTFNRSRAPGKFLEHGLHGTAMVVGDLPPYAELEHGRHVLKASTPEQWREHVLALVEDAELRRSLGEAARAEVLEHWTTAARTPEWQAWLQGATGGGS